MKKSKQVKKSQTHQKDDWFNDVLDENKKLAIPIGPRFQADVAEWTGPPQIKYPHKRLTKSTSSKWLGTVIWSNKESTPETEIGKGRPDSCDCHSPGAISCIKRHIALKRTRLQKDVGPAFYKWKFDEMGEAVAKLWKHSEQQKFIQIVRNNPISEETSELFTNTYTMKNKKQKTDDSGKQKSKGKNITEEEIHERISKGRNDKEKPKEKGKKVTEEEVHKRSSKLRKDKEKQKAKGKNITGEEVHERRSQSKNDKEKPKAKGKNVTEEEVHEKRSRARNDKAPTTTVEKPRRKTRKGDVKGEKPQPQSEASSKKRKAPVKKTKNNTKKELVDENSDSDFEHNALKKKQTKETKIDFHSMRNRCSPGALLSVIQGLSKQQKMCVHEMGFGGLLKMKMMDVPGSLSYYILSNFDPTTNKIRVQNGQIDVTKESVHDMLGLPLGEISFTDLKFRTPEDTCFEDWTNQFTNKSMIRLTEIKTKIVSTKQADMNFKMNFIALFVNALCESSSMGKCNIAPLNYIMRDTEISNIDWCSYLIDCLGKTKHSYDPSNPKTYFVGPCAFLVLLYIDSVQCQCIEVERRRPTICYWTSEKVKFRESFEKDILGAFGTGKLYEPYVQEHVEEETEDDEPYCNDLTEEEYESNILRKKGSLQTLIGKAIDKFPENNNFSCWKTKIDAIVENLNVEASMEPHEKENIRDGLKGHGGDGEEQNDEMVVNLKNSNELQPEFSQFWLSPTLQYRVDNPLQGTDEVFLENSRNDDVKVENVEAGDYDGGVNNVEAHDDDAGVEHVQHGDGEGSKQENVEQNNDEVGNYDMGVDNL